MLANTLMTAIFNADEILNPKSVKAEGLTE